jgi:hypothetical protein
VDDVVSVCAPVWAGTAALPVDAATVPTDVEVWLAVAVTAAVTLGSATTAVELETAGVVLVLAVPVGAAVLFAGVVAPAELPGDCWAPTVFSVSTSPAISAWGAAAAPAVAVCAATAF